MDANVASVDATVDANGNAEENQAAPSVSGTRAGVKRLSLSSSLSLRRLSGQFSPQRLGRAYSKRKSSGSTIQPAP
ncbi:hypothetical protein JDV02_003281 [Purpureocillium takamizusanense]|uniref:Uncharacterized protein n=1 Tax=Purpureocillium takamizusanense TaxID=2060973 RepID=A0A9Q8QDG6_9HYPO|nr:uncharacterized protein JDV02_003281 [Purpureocillium takamizusanense]UNI16891.1 hypothetical protein JDV02_003281 [Purpureocillium takamizusanense]